MRPGSLPSFVSDFYTFSDGTCASLDGEPNDAFAGVSKDGKLCWIVKGAHLEVVDVQSKDRVAAWRFGKVLKDEHTSVTCVKEYEQGKSCKLLVGVCNASTSGMLCLFDVATSRVVKAIEIPQQITEVEMIYPWMRHNIPRWALSEHLRYFCGLVAVGTNSGHVLLVDLCMDDSDYYSDEEFPGKLHFISPRIRDTENQRFDCTSKGLHLCMHLNEQCFTRNGFQYMKPDGIVMKTFRADAVSITCLKYIPQAGILVLGFNFGCYQLWKLHIPVLEYSSRLENDPLPVTNLAYQEPENDPKNFCYIWVARGQWLADDEQKFDTSSSICLYQLTFNKKTFYSNYGVFYEDLTSVCLRLDYELGLGPLIKTDVCSKLIDCYTLMDPHYQPPSRMDEDESFEEGVHGPDLSLCVFVWEAVEGNLSGKVTRHMAIFDINRWYHSQMPSTVRFSSATETCPYLSFSRLDEASDKAHSDSLLALYVNADTMRKFNSNSPMPPEQHFYPSSLAFETKLIFEAGIVQAQFLGSQRQVLSTIEGTGPSVLIQPQDWYSLCISIGLLPRPMDIASTNPNLVFQRESLLSLTLEYNMLGFLQSCITQWATGEYDNQGCTLKFLLDWAWEKVSKTKHQIDSVCVNLYNWSGIQLDQRALQSLQQASQRLNHLVTLFKAFAGLTGPITDQGQMDLNSKQLVTSLISFHLSVVLWFVETGLLPENDEAEDFLDNQYSYPACSLIQAYKKRRGEMQCIHSDIGETDLLMIDGMVDQMGVYDLWEREGGTGLYPPPSFHALLSTYLLEDVDMLSKHCLVLYVLLDLVSVDSTDNSEQFSEKVSGFAKRFNIPCTLVKLIQGFWLLDHKDFEEALVLMLDPLVTTEYSKWQHKRVIKSLLYQGDSKLALRYINSVKPALTTPEEVKLKLTVFLANGLTAEALEYQRMCRDHTNMADLMSHLFLGCQQTKTIDRLLQLPLTTKEEQLLVSYLMESTEPYSQELLVMHYLQRARFTEAIQLNDKLKQSILNDPSSTARERAASRNAIVESYTAILPSVQRKLLFEQIHVPKKNITWRREVRRPTPLSTKVTKSKSTVMSQSTLIMTIMEKLDEIEADEKPSPQVDSNRSSGPFICTPITPSRISQRETPATIYLEPSDGLSLGMGDGLVFRKTPSSLRKTDTPSTADRRTSKYFSASCLALLQTPEVNRMTPRKQRLSSANVLTPQSILKVRHLISTTSPSPHSANVTPNSNELDTSARKLPRKLGYGATSQPTTPRSVSFHDPPLSSLPRHLAGEMSLPVSPKSVSFADESKTPGTPKQTRFTETKSSSVKKSALKLLDIPRSVKDRSPTPESPEKSPRLAQRVDQLHRPGIHASQRQEENSENISDDDVEEMEASYDTATSPGANESLTSTSTVRSAGLSPQSVSSPKTPPKIASPVSPTVSFKPRVPGSPSVKIPGSPTVKISKSAVSSYAGSDVISLTQTGSQIANERSPVKDVKENVIEPVDLTESDDNMETDADADISSSAETADENRPELRQGRQVSEIFEKDEEISGEGEIEEMDLVTSSTGTEQVVVDQEDTEHNETGVKIEQEEAMDYPEPPLLERQLIPPEPLTNTPQQAPYKITARKSLTPPWERNLKLLQPPSVKISPKSSPRQSPQPSPKLPSSPKLSGSPKLPGSPNEALSVKISPKSSPKHSSQQSTNIPSVTYSEENLEIQPLLLKISPKSSPSQSPQQSPKLPMSPKLEPLELLDIPLVVPPTEEAITLASPETEQSSIKASPKSSPQISPKSSPKSPKASPRFSPNLSHTSIQQSPIKLEAEEVLQEIDDKFLDTPPRTSTRRASKISVLSETEAGPSSKNLRNARTFDVPIIKEETEDVIPEQAPLTPTRTRSQRKGRELSAEPTTPTRSQRKERESSTEPMTPTRSMRKGREASTEPMTPTRSMRKGRESSTEPMTPTRSSRRLKEKELNVQTPPRSTRKGKKGEENVAATPTRGRGRKVKDEIDLQEIIKEESPTSLKSKHFTRRGKETVQESLKKLIDEKNSEELMMEMASEVTTGDISAAAYLHNSEKSHNVDTSEVKMRRAKETVQESLKKMTDENNSEELMEVVSENSHAREVITGDITGAADLHSIEKAKDLGEDNLQQITKESMFEVWEREQKSPDDGSPNRLTRIKARERASVSPAPSPSHLAQTPAMLTPTRMSRRLAEKENIKTQTDSDDTLAKTPPRVRRARKTIDTAQSPAVASKTTDKLITPFRGRKKKEEGEGFLKEPVSPSRNKTVDLSNKSPVKTELDLEDNVKTPTRGRKKKEDKINETVDEKSALTPTRKSSRLRRDSVDEFNIGDKNITIDTEFQDIDSNTVTRRHSFSRSDLNLERLSGDSSDAPIGRRQSFTRSQAKKEDIFNADKFERPATRRHTIGISGFKIDSEKVETVKPRTPQRGRKGAHNNKISPEREPTDTVTPVTTPSRRGRPRKTGISPIKESIEEETDQTKVEKGTPSRRGRGKKLNEDVELKQGIEEETDQIKDEKGTPSRRGRGKKSNEDVELKQDKMEAGLDEAGSGDIEHGSRKEKVAREEDDVKEPEPAVETKEKTTASRSKRQKTGKDGGISPEKVVIAESFAALVQAVDIVPSSPFQFADPMQIDGEEVEPRKPFTPMKSFIFSPPISRTRLAVKEKSPQPEGILLPPGPAEQEPVKMSKRPRRKTKKLYTENDEVLLISPLSQGDGDSGAEGRGVITRETRHSTRQAELKKEGTKTLVRTLLKRPVRTKHRFGPVGKKTKTTK